MPEARLPSQPATAKLIIPLELVAQRKLHDAGVGQQACIIAERGARLLQRWSTVTRSSHNVKAREVRHVEDLPAELQGMTLPRHVPPLAQAHIQARVAISAERIARTALTGEWMNEIVQRGRGVSKNADCSGNGILENSRLRLPNHQPAALFVPVCGPELTVVHGERKPGGPAKQSGELPPSDNCIGNGTRVPSQRPSFPQHQIHNPPLFPLM